MAIELKYFQKNQIQYPAFVLNTFYKPNVWNLVQIFNANTAHETSYFSKQFYL